MTTIAATCARKAFIVLHLAAAAPRIASFRLNLASVLQVQVFLFFSPGWEGRAGQRTGLVGSGKFSKRPVLSLCSSIKIRQSITRKVAQIFAQARFAFWIQAAMSSALFRSTRQIESCDAVIRVYDEAGNVIETHEHKGEISRSGITLCWSWRTMIACRGSPVSGFETLDEQSP